MDDGYTVGELARLSGVSVRTLHHYDAIGLLTPHARSTANHRRYTGADVARLRQILFYRELEFGLEEIAEILADPAVHPDAHLRRQHRLLRERRARIDGLLDAVEHELRASGSGIALTAAEQLEIFDTDRFGSALAEVEQQWGVDAHTAAYTKEDWAAIKAEADSDIASFAAALAAGEPADGEVAMRAAEDHRTHLARWFFPCSHRQHRKVAAHYLSDPATVAQWDEIAPGFAWYVHDAIVANADRAGS
ncbi:DNA-binding transcriptional MerR regulator [Rhodococcus sp. OK611]|uniref:MerR family transcriptional regulator n=1 Tax=unclassified Rhodococcus (in: high G+C Gram-positive bacteria) TaxID=192944 RepID=UPI000BCAF898|nr:MULTISPECIES: MerR family transcriptional regulator [unclassified Rhodococcus (in: high G+C Gram-positive bacteria)]PTR43604.1 DNA-binding transcriptional MerR regulator [Rhodococcus sp. OK611]SNX90949.1 DNA-binding transcriptional regulator, MerR family [Rhodococcus sp. OK270]